MTTLNIIYGIIKCKQKSSGHLDRTTNRSGAQITKTEIKRTWVTNEIIAHLDENSRPAYSVGVRGAHGGDYFDPCTKTTRD